MGMRTFRTNATIKEPVARIGCSWCKTILQAASSVLFCLLQEQRSSPHVGFRHSSRPWWWGFSCPTPLSILLQCHKECTSASCGDLDRSSLTKTVVERGNVAQILVHVPSHVRLATECSASQMHNGIKVPLREYQLEITIILPYLLLAY